MKALLLIRNICFVSKETEAEAGREAEAERYPAPKNVPSACLIGQSEGVDGRNLQSWGQVHKYDSSHYLRPSLIQTELFSHEFFILSFLVFFNLFYIGV